MSSTGQTHACKTHTTTRSQLPTMPFSLPEPQSSLSFIPPSSNIFVQARPPDLKSSIPPLPRPTPDPKLDSTTFHAYSSRHYPASDVASSRAQSSPKPGRGGSVGAHGLADDLQLLSLTGTEDARSLSTSPSPSPRPAGTGSTHSAPYAPFPQSCVTLPSLRASCCASSGIFSDASSDFPSSATFTAETSPRRGPPGPPRSTISPRQSPPQPAAAGIAPISCQAQSPSCKMPQACDIRSPRPSSRRPTRNPFRSPPPSAVRSFPPLHRPMHSDLPSASSCPSVPGIPPMQQRFAHESHATGARESTTVNTSTIPFVVYFACSQSASP